MRARAAWSGIKFARIGVSALVLKAVNADLGRRYVVRELSRMPGLSAKLGQLLALKFGKTEWQEFAPEPVPIGWVKARIEAEAPRLAAELDEIEPRAELASLGQVHRARLKSGETVAVKVKYPQVDQEIEEQLDLVLLAFGNLPRAVGRAFDLASYEAFLRAFFREETDYLAEARTQQRFRDAWSGRGGIVIPAVHHELSTAGILVQSCEPSVALAQLWGEPLAVRSACARALATFFLGGLTRDGLVHCDFHPKNWGFRPDSAELVVYDFGATLRLDDRLRRAVLALLGADPADEGECRRAYEELGFSGKTLEPLAGKLGPLNRVFFAPLWSPRPADLGKWRTQERTEAILGPAKWEFRAAGPPWFLMLIRGFNGWLYAQRELRAPVSLRDCWPAGIDLPPLREELPEPAPAPEPAASPRTPATSLRVVVSERGEERVSLEFPARTVEQLEDLVPDDVRTEVVRLGIDLTELKNRAIRSGLVPQELFAHWKGERLVRVWLE